MIVGIVFIRSRRVFDGDSVVHTFNVVRLSRGAGSRGAGGHVWPVSARRPAVSGRNAVDDLTTVASVAKLNSSTSCLSCALLYTVVRDGDWRWRQTSTKNRAGGSVNRVLRPPGAPSSQAQPTPKKIPISRTRKPSLEVAPTILTQRTPTNTENTCRCYLFTVSNSGLHFSRQWQVMLFTILVAGDFLLPRNVHV